MILKLDKALLSLRNFVLQPFVRSQLLMQLAVQLVAINNGGPVFDAVF